VKNAENNGIGKATVFAIHQRQSTAGLPADEAAIVEYVWELLRRHRVDENKFQSLLARLGVNGMVELTAAVGYYSMVSCTLNAFELSSSPDPEDFPI
jgi:4-carboxymuconolactone decarboxylase